MNRYSGIGRGADRVAETATFSSIRTNGAPSSPLYSQAVVFPPNAPIIRLSGQLPMDPSTGRLVNGDITAATERVFQNIEAILKAAGSSFDRVVSVEIFCTDMKKDFTAINAVYKRYFTGEDMPARQSIEVAGLPFGAEIEISITALGRAKL